MPKKLKGVTLEFSKEALAIPVLVIEGIKCHNTIKPTGNRWVCELKELSVGKDDDIDIGAMIEGFYKTKFSVTLKVKGKKDITFKDLKFTKMGLRFFYQTIKLSELKNA